MAAAADERIVSMQFNNQQFEKGVHQTLGTLNKLKQGLNLDSSAKSLSNLSKASSKFSMDSVADSIAKISSKFTAMGMIGVTALQDIARSAINTGKRMVSALTIDPVKTGFNEYELKMNSVQTIMASTGESLSTVNSYLEELNTYSDRTIYSFQDMTSNIGKFTNAGVKLEDAVAAIKGISNEAAVSGANSNEASRAMYNFSQALSSGAIRLIDWKSIENANMATKEFKQQLIDTAVEVGTLTQEKDGMYKKDKQLFNSTKSFNDSLQEQWMTSEVLIETLKKYADESTDIGKKAYSAAQDVKTFSQLYDTLKEAAQSGWAQTWEILVGDLEEAKQLLTGISNVVGGMIGRSAEMRNNLLKGWDALGGRLKLIEAGKDAFEALSRVVMPIKGAFRDIFPAMTADRLYKITESVANFAKKSIISIPSVNKIRHSFRGLFAAFDIGKMAIGSFLKGFKPLGSALKNGASMLLDMSASLGDYIVGLRDSIKENGIFATMTERISKITKPLSEGMSKAFNKISESVKNFSFKELFSGTKKFSENSGVMSAAGERISAAFSKIGQSAKGISPNLGKAFETVKTVFGKITGFIKDKVTNFDFNALFGIFNGTLATGMVGTLTAFLKKLASGGKKKDKKSGPSFLENIQNIINGITGSLEAFQTRIKAGALLQVAKAIAVISGSLALLSFIDTSKVLTALAGIVIAIGALYGAMVLFQTLGKIKGGSGMFSMKMMAKTLTNIATAVLLMAQALKTVSNVSWPGLAKGIIGVGAILAELSLFMKFTKTAGPGRVKGLLSLAVSMLIMSQAIKMIGEIDTPGVVKGVLAIGAVLLAIAGFFKLAGGSFGYLSMSFGLDLIAVSMLGFAASLALIGQIPVNKLANSLSAMIILLTALTLALNFIPASAIVGAASLLVVSVALMALVPALVLLSKISWTEIGQGLVMLLGALTILGAAVGVLGAFAAATIPGALALTLISASMLALVPALLMIGKISWSEIRRGLTMMASSLLILAVGVTLMAVALPGAAALLVISAALLALAPALKMLGSMEWSEVGRGLTMLGSSIMILAVGGVLLLAAVPGLILFAVAAGMLSGAIAMAGAGMVMFSYGLKAFIDIASVGADKFVEFTKKTAEGLPEIAEHVGDAIVILAGKVSEAAPKIGEAMGKAMAAAADVAVENASIFANAGLQIILETLNGISANMDQITDKGTEVAVKFMNGIARSAPVLAYAGYRLGIDLMNGLAGVIRDNSDELYDAMTNLAAACTSSFLGALQRIVINIPGIGKAMASKVGEWRSALDSQFANAPNPVKDWFGNMNKGSEANAIRESGTKSAAEYMNGYNQFMKEHGSMGTFIAPKTDMQQLFNQTMGPGGTNIPVSVTPDMSGSMTMLGGQSADQWASGFMEKIIASGGLETMMSDIFAQTGMDPADMGIDMSTFGETLLADTASGAESASGDMQQAGANAGANYGTGLESSAGTANAAGSNTAGSGARGAASTKGDFFASGIFGGQGLIDGILSLLGAANGAGSQLGHSVVEGVNGSLEINSPSRVLMRSGMYADQGMAKGLLQYSDLVKSGGEQVGNSAIDGVKSTIKNFSDVISGELDNSPRIRPVVDLSDVHRKTREISAIFGSDPSATFGFAENRTASISEHMRLNRVGAPEVTAVPATSSGNTISYVQNNYSPKALSRIELYRQTKNLISMKR